MLFYAKTPTVAVDDPCKFVERATGSILENGVKQNFIDDATKYYIQPCKNEDK